MQGLSGDTADTDMNKSFGSGPRVLHALKLVDDYGIAPARLQTVPEHGGRAGKQA